jgi:sec-independent protein translocase protein TatA
MVMQIPAGFEWLILAVLIVVIFFGVKKIPQFARSFGKASSEYEKAKIEAKRELQQIKNQEPSKVDREKLETIAETLGIDYADKNSDDLRTAIEAEIAKGKKPEVWEGTIAFRQSSWLVGQGNYSRQTIRAKLSADKKTCAFGNQWD